MRRKWVVTFALVSIVAGLFPLRAQDGAPVMPADCSEATIKDAVHNTKAIVDDLDTLVNSGGAIDTALVSQALEIVRNYVGLLKAHCDGLAFEGESETVLGPVVIPAGLYRVTLKSDGQGVISVEALKGACGEGTGSLMPGLFFYNKGDASNEIETLFTSEECTAVFKVTTKVSWSLAFEKLN